MLGGAGYLFASVAEPGVIAHTGGVGALLFGELDGSVSARAVSGSASSAPRPVSENHLPSRV